MPDLTPEIHYACSSHENFETFVQGSRGNQYQVRHMLLSPPEQERQGAQYGWHCSCPGYKFRGWCRHVEQVKAVPHGQGGACLWDSFVSGGEPMDDNGTDRCPRCGAEVTPYTAMV